VQVRVDADGQLEELVARFAAPGNDKLPTQFTRLRVERVAGKLVAYSTLAPLRRSRSWPAARSAPPCSPRPTRPAFRTRWRRSSPRSSPPTSTSAASSRRARPSRRLRGADRRRRAGHLGQRGAAAVLAAEFVNKSQTYSAMWFKDGDGKGSYFGLDGQSKQRSLLSSPLEFSRVTSGFAMRMHPILNTWKQHNGVDYGAPSGTPVRTIGDGVVEFAGWQNGYGNVVHDQAQRRPDDGLCPPEPGRHRQGRQGRAGQTIGAVGQTGWATGPHLHFEVKIDGVQQDPLLVAQSSKAIVLTPAARTQLASCRRASGPSSASPDAGARASLGE
jgi:murein DD-endopeptidase MepM/ murein hydrolase activator NlpD